MKSFLKITAMFIVFYSISSCEEVIDVTVPNGGDRLVVEASILWEKGTSGQNQSITLSKSTAYFTNTTFVPIVSASVNILNSTTGEVFVFDSQDNGTYTTTNFSPIINDSYTLTIEYNNEIYFSEETLFPVVEIDAIEQNLVNEFGGEEIQVKIFFNDPMEISNYYLGQFIPSNNSLPSLTTLSDNFSNGNQNVMDYDDEELSVGQTIDITLQGISEGFYNYITLLEEQADANGPFATTPARLKGNCVNMNNANEEVLGFFRLSEVDRVIYTIIE